MRLTLDRDACQGHNRCYLLAPELFDVDDEGYAVLVGDGTVPVELEEKAMLARFGPRYEEYRARTRRWV